MSKKSPQLRFEGFTDDWEERKFSNLAEVRRGLTYKPSDVQKYGIRVLRSSNIAEDTFLIKSDDVFVNKEAVKIDKVKNGDILITSANGSSRLVGKHALIEGIENDTVRVRLIPSRWSPQRTAWIRPRSVWMKPGAI